MRISIRNKLLISYITLIMVLLIVLVIVILLSLPNAYGRHLGQMDPIIFGTGMGGMHNNTVERTNLIFSNFRLSLLEALGWAILISVAVSFIISIIISRSLTLPLQSMLVASQRIAAGEYGYRIPQAGTDELGVLSTSFNTMAGKLEEIETRRSQLIGDVAHELRTPLTIIQGSMEGLVDGVFPPTSDTFNKVTNEIERLTRLVNDLQELSKAEAGELNLQLKGTLIEKLYQVAVDQMVKQFTDKGIELRLNLPESLPIIMVDQDRILQVIINILSNALHFTPKGGLVDISVINRDKDILTSITDNGIGISNQHITHIFDRFYRVDRSRSRQEGGGSGIGLTISKYIIKAHAGDLWAESLGEGQGTTISFTLPKGKKISKA